MRLIYVVAAGLALAPVLGHADDARDGTVTVLPPAGNPRAYTPAPVPDVGPTGTDPSNRAGNANDAGPINATPLSSNLAPGLGSGVAGRAERQNNPTADVVPGTGEAGPGHE